MENITYLLGAGASAQAIPTVYRMKSRMKQMIDVLTGMVRGNNFHGRESVAKKFVTDLKEMYEDSARHATFDTYMRRLYLTNSRNYDRYKLLLSAYLSLEHIYDMQDKEHPDQNLNGL